MIFYEKFVKLSNAFLLNENKLSQCFFFCDKIRNIGKVRKVVKIRFFKIILFWINGKVYLDVQASFAFKTVNSASKAINEQWRMLSKMTGHFSSKFNLVTSHILNSKINNWNVNKSLSCDWSSLFWRDFLSSVPFLFKWFSAKDFYDIFLGCILNQTDRSI